VICRFVMICGFVSSLTWLILMLQAYVSEISSANHQALGVSIIGTSWGLGLILGPALGGYLSQPALKYPNIFTEGSLFAR
jgi:MFS family permease